MSEDYMEDFEEVEEEINISPDHRENKKQNKRSSIASNNYGENAYNNGRNSENRNPLNKHGSISNSAKTRKTVALKPITNTTKNTRDSRYDDDDEVEYAGRQREKTPPRKLKSEVKYKKGEMLEFDFKASSSKPKMLSPSRDYTKQSITSSVSYCDQYREVLESESNFKNAKEIEKENEKIREYLRDLNTQLSKMVDHTSIANFAPKKHTEFKYKSLDEKHKIISREISNNLKILETTYDEYQKLKARHDSIKSPEYVLDIEEKLEDTLKNIEKIKKANLKLNLASVASGRDLHDIENEQGIPNNIKEANNRAKDLALLKRKIDKLVDQNAQFDKERAIKSEKAEELQKKYDKLLVITENLKLTTNDQKKSERYIYLKRQVANLEDNVKHTQNGHQKYVGNQIMREIEEFMVANERDKEHIRKLEEMIEQQKIALKDMIDKEGLRGRNDKTTQEVIKKIELSLEPNAANVDTSFLEGETSSKNNKTKPTKPPLSKEVKKDIYEGLPLFSPSKMKKEEASQKKMIIRKTDLMSERKAINSSMVEKEEEKNEFKPAFKIDKKAIDVSPERNVGLNDNKIIQEEKPKEDTNPAFSKPNLFKKPFGGKKSERPEENSMTFENSTKLVDNSTTQPTNEKIFLTDNILAKEKKNEGLSMPGFLQNDKKPLESQRNNNEPLRLSEEFQPKKQGLTNDTNNTITLTENKSPNNNSKLVTELPLDESVQLGGVSRLNKARRNRGVEEKTEPTYDPFKESQNSGRTNDINLNNNKQKDLSDPFAKFDNVDNLNFGNKKISDTQTNKQPQNNQYQNIGLFNPTDEPAVIKNTTNNKVDNNKITTGLFVADDFESAHSKVQVRKGPRDRLNAAKQTDDLFGSIEENNIEDKPKIDLSVKQNPITIGNKPKKINTFGSDDNDVFTKKEEPSSDFDFGKNDIYSKKNDDIYSKKNDDLFGKKNDDLFGNKEVDFFSTNNNTTEPKAQEKFSLAPTNDVESIGGKPKRMKMGAKKEEAKGKELDLAKKAEKGGAGFFDEFEL